jgi:hypothetical protein
VIIYLYIPAFMGVTDPFVVSIYPQIMPVIKKIARSVNQPTFAKISR